MRWNAQFALFWQQIKLWANYAELIDYRGKDGTRLRWWTHLPAVKKLSGFN